MSHEWPTLVVRIETDANIGWNCHTVASRLVHAPVLDAKWSHEPTKWRERGGGWPRMRLEPQEKALVQAASVLVEHGVAQVPQTIVEELLNIIERVSK